MSSRFHLTDEEHQKIYRLRDKDKLTVSQLAERFKVSPETIIDSLAKTIQILSNNSRGK